jgi:hypothetical protein
MNSSLRQKITFALFGLAVLWTFSGCTPLNKWADSVTSVWGKNESSKKVAYYVHSVRWSGESLSIIAKWYTGRLENWKLLAKANPKLNPSRIIIGNKIRIPKNLLKTRKPMPKYFVDRLVPKQKRVSPPPPKPTPPPPPEEDEPELFGPKR